MSPEILQLIQNPANHERLAEILAGISAPPVLPDMMQGSAPQTGGQDFGMLLGQNPGGQ